jgi:hypothetical protein
MSMNSHRSRVIVCLGLTLAAAGARAWDSPPPNCGSAPFVDVPQIGGYCPWIRQADLDDLTAGCGGGAYCPDGPLSRKAAALVLERAMRGTAPHDVADAWYGRTVLVSPVAGDALASGQALRDGLAALPALNPLLRGLVKLEPGRYDLGATPLVLAEWIDLEGSGEGATLIVGQPPAPQPLVKIGRGAGLRWVTLAATGGRGVGMEPADDEPARRLEHVTIAANGFAVDCEGSGDGKVLISHATLTAAGSGAENAAVITSGCTLAIEESTLTGQGGTHARGLRNQNGAVTIERSLVRASDASSVNVALRQEYGGSITVDGVVARALSGSGGGQAQGLHVLAGDASLADSDFASTGSGACALCSSTDGVVTVVSSRLAGGSISTKAGVELRIAASQAANVSLNNPGSIVCYGVYDENFANLNGFDQCP